MISGVCGHQFLQVSLKDSLNDENDIGVPVSPISPFINGLSKGPIL